MKKISPSLLVLACALAWNGCSQSGDPLASGNHPSDPELFSVQKKPGGGPGNGGGGGGGGGGKGSATALVAIGGGIQTEVEQTFSIAKDSKRTLQLDTPGGFPVALRTNFAATQANCGADPLLADLKASLLDPEGIFALRRYVTIRVDVSNLKQEGDVSTTGSDAHFIEVWTDPNLDGGSYLWVPEGPKGPNSGPVTVELVSDSVVDGTRVRQFRFSSNQLQVWTGAGESQRILRCANLDPPIEVTVRTTP